MTVAENVFLGEEDQFSKVGNVSMRKLNQVARKILDENGLSYVDPKKPIETYSFEDRKMIETARSPQPAAQNSDYRRNHHGPVPKRAGSNL